MGESTKFSLFIVESLSYADEESRREGQILRDIFRLSGHNVDYIYIRTRKELRWAIRQFKKSEMRYLHVSSHGDHGSIALSLDNLSFDEFGDDIRQYLNGRRVFMSACAVVNPRLAKALLDGSGCYSLIGPKTKINFDDAALMWASFYHLMFRDGEQAMKDKAIRDALGKVHSTFGLEFDYFKKSSISKEGYKKIDIPTPAAT